MILPPNWTFPRIHIGLIFGFAALLSSDRLPAAEGRPNLVFIYTDDQAPTAVGFAGNSELRTPHIDRLARSGAILRNAFTVTPVCSPSRAGLMTARYGSELDILDWINPKTEPEAGLNPNTITWVELLQEAGYATCLSGKWHLGTEDRYHPTLTGYDEFMGLRDGGRPPKDPILEIGGHPTQTQGFTVDLVTEHALDFIRRQRTGPFLASIHYREPHAAWLPVREEDWIPYRDLEPTLPPPGHPDLDTDRVLRITREYYASVASVDRNVGRLLDLLDELGIADKTIVVFTSDHGYHLGHHGLLHKGNAQWVLKTLPEQRWPNIGRKQRPNLLDQALRVPACVRWPAKISPGTEVTETVSNLDWFPTLLAMAGVDVPEDLLLRGRNFLPLMLGESLPWSNDLYAEYSMRHGATADMRCLRTPEWKLMIDFANPGREELYDLRKDPGELTNLVDAEDPEAQRIRREFRGRILEKLREIQDPILSTIPREPEVD